ncbi:hypothetical protein L8106_03704 [Lyngbya sp. PCC 8106]|nr:hypothetical protein L8106_03704 [Lyngbya sp. PCC 8106]
MPPGIIVFTPHDNIKTQKPGFSEKPGFLNQTGFK